MNVKILQLHKRASYTFQNIQDKYAISSTYNIIALADGTTQSFKSELWAEIITQEFVKTPIFLPQSLISIFKDCVHVYKNTKFEFSSNPAIASLERKKLQSGGTSTFMGIRINDTNTIEVISCGDTNIFIVNAENRIKSFPFSDIDSLDANNYFINTEALLQNKLNESFFKYTSLLYSPSDTTILATDALSRLILKNPQTIKELLSIKTFEDLLAFCVRNWEKKELQEDDISAILLTPGNLNDLQLICPPPQFEFPKEEETEFIAASTNRNQPTQNSTLEMHEIRNQFNGVAKDMNEIKNKLKLHEILLMITISLLLINILLSYILRPQLAKSVTEQSNPSINIETFNDTSKENQESDTNISAPTNDETIRKDNIENQSNLNNQGMDENEIMKKQQELIKAGYKVKADGHWGEKSQRAWEQYKSKK